MTAFNLAKVSLRVHEGVRSKAYDDRTGKEVRLSPPSKLTIGVGHNLEAKGLPPGVIDMLLDMDVRDAEFDAVTVINDPLAWAEMGAERRAVLIEMAFQLGPIGFAAFRKTLEYIRRGLYADAALEMLDSKWAREDSPARAKTLSDRFRDGFSPFAR